MQGGKVVEKREMVVQIIVLHKKRGRTNNNGGGFDYNQQIQTYQGSKSQRGQGL